MVNIFYIILKHCLLKHRDKTAARLKIGPHTHLFGICLQENDEVSYNLAESVCFITDYNKFVRIVYDCLNINY